MRKILIKSKTELARIFGVAVQTIDKWRAKGMPGKPEGWPLLEIIPWWRERILAEVKKAGERSDPNMRLKRYRADLVKFELETRRQKYILAEEHLDFIAELSRLFRNRLLSLAGSLGSQIRGLDPAAADQAIRDRIWELLEDIAKHAGHDPPKKKRARIHRME